MVFLMVCTVYTVSVYGAFRVYLWDGFGVSKVKFRVGGVGLSGLDFGWVLFRVFERLRVFRVWGFR